MNCWSGWSEPELRPLNGVVESGHGRSGGWIKFTHISALFHQQELIIHIVRHIYTEREMLPFPVSFDLTAPLDLNPPALTAR
jgi:hypothetical protein